MKDSKVKQLIANILSNRFKKKATKVTDEVIDGYCDMSKRVYRGVIDGVIDSGIDNQKHVLDLVMGINKALRAAKKVKWDEVSENVQNSLKKELDGCEVEYAQNVEKAIEDVVEAANAEAVDA